MPSPRFSFLLLLVPVFFAGKCRKDKNIDDDFNEIVLPASPELTLQVTAVEPNRPEADVSFRGVVYGSGFEDGANVWVGDEQLNTVVYRDENTLTVSVPALSPGGYDVRVRNPDGESATLRAGIVVRTSQSALPAECRSIRVNFNYDAYSITPQARQTLAAAAKCFEVQGISVRVEGHCDERGTTEYNLALGQRRADTIKRYLISQGVTPSRISTVSYGEEKPLEYGHNESAWRANRRAEILVSE